MRFLATFLLLAASAALADDSIEVKLAKGRKVTVDQTLELASDGINENGKGEGTMSGNPDIKLVEKWTDESKADDAGKATEVERTIASSKMTIWSEPQTATSTDGCVFKLARSGDASSAEATKGTPEAKTTTLLGRAPIDPVELLLPDKPVKAGATWDIPEDKMLAFFDAIGASVPGARGKSGKAVQMILGLALGNGKQTLVESVALKAKLKDVKAGVATIEVSGAKDITGEDLGKIKGYGKGYCKVAGTLKINVTTGMPDRLDMTMNQLKGAGTGGAPPADTGGWKQLGFKDDWKLTRVYTAPK